MKDYKPMFDNRASDIEEEAICWPAISSPASSGAFVSTYESASSCDNDFVEHRLLIALDFDPHSLDARYEQVDARRDLGDIGGVWRGKEIYCDAMQGIVGSSCRSKMQVGVSWQMGSCCNV
jgi:hypothetical protein